MLFHDLNEHVLAEILARCDIYTVLSFTRVNKYCRHLALAHKQLWISLIRDLECRGLLDLPPAANMQEYTTVDLIDEVKRVVQGPKTWSPAYPSPPVLQRETIVRFEQPRGGNRTSFSVLPGGRYFALTDRWTALEVWELATGRCVWTHPHSISCWSFDMVDGGDVAFMVCHVHNPSYNAAIEVIRLDLHTGQSSDIIRIPLPGMRNSSLATLRGDFFAISLNIQLPSAQLLIVNWRAETYALLRFPPFFMTRPAILPGHVAITYAEPRGLHQQLLEVYAFDTLRWSPVERISNGRPIFWYESIPQTVSPAICVRLELQNTPLCAAQGLELTAYKSPLHTDAYKVTLYASVRTPPGRFTSLLRGALGGQARDVVRAVLYSYHFESPPGKAAIWRPVSVVPAAYFVHGCPQLTFSGYGVDPSYFNTTFLDARLERDGVLSAVGREVLPIHMGRSERALGVYSGVVAALEPYSLTISYFV